MRRGRIQLVLSTLLLVGMVSLHVASYGREMHGSWRTARARYIVRFSDGKLAMWGLPPPALTASVARNAELLVEGLRNDRLVWDRLGVDDAGWVAFEPNRLPVNLDTDNGKAVSAAGAKILARPLLLALDDPERIAAAHVALMTLTPMSRTSWAGGARHT